MSEEAHIVWLTEYRMFAQLMSMHAHYSVVRYTRDGQDYEFEVGNDEWEEIFDYE